MKLYLLPGDRYLLSPDRDLNDSAIARLRELVQGWLHGETSLLVSGSPIEVVDLRQGNVLNTTWTATAGTIDKINAMWRT